ncbi:MAG: hypothetical protein IKG91_03365 [Firmicutes bacterium]|nr:hypothetical protein [Bacillota bacterium]
MVLDQEAYLKGRVVFFGSRLSPLPKGLLWLFEKCRTRYIRHTDCLKKQSRSQLVFDEENNTITLRRKKQPQESVTAANAVVWVSLFESDRKDGRKWFLVGMGVWGIDVDETVMGGFDAPSQMLIAADAYLEKTVYAKVCEFAQKNPGRYLAEYRFDQEELNEEDNRIRRRFDCAACEKREGCDHLSCEKKRHTAWKTYYKQRFSKEEAARRGELYESCFPIAVIDMEWEGANPTQFAGLLIENSKKGLAVTRTLDLYIRLPKGKKMSPIVRGLTHISDDLLRREGVPIKEALERISAFLKRANVICGQGVRSDFDILSGAYERAEMEKPAVLASGMIMDTAWMEMEVDDLPHVISLKEETEVLGVRHKGERFHDARVDALLAARLTAVLLPVFILKYGKAPIIPMVTQRHPEGTRLLSDFDGTPKKKSLQKK